ncbi:MAG: DNA mismatch repair endonuclease MutL [Eubacterium sp.]|jgi:DNA mismatch repair protein MutL|nr:DNA mismatch repair endonuclease MutL [Eubacterium sp.]
MAKINLLDKNVAELIAAGEVIDRPASLVKELIENAVDAEANSVTVEIMDGGISFIRVTDNGCGIPYEEMPTAFLRHATSKVYSERDLESISTMGFRGEALSSIAAVAKVTMMSRDDSSEGAEYKIDGGVEISHSKSACPAGTTIIIRDLFFNTPARLKFLKKDVSEGNAIQTVVDRLAIIHPEISFKFIRDNKPVRVTGGDGRMYSAIYSIFGRQFADSLIPVDYGQNGIIIRGYISSPLFPRGNRTMQYFYVNRRYIKSTACMAAVESAFQGSIMTGKFPACVINLDVDPSSIDVNVHPAKTEVRFSDDNKIFDTVYFAVKNAILNADNKNQVAIAEKPKYERSLETKERGVNTGVVLSSFKSAYLEKAPIHTNFEFENNASAKAYSVRVDAVEEHFGPEETVEKERLPSFENVAAEGVVPIKVIGELFKTYILCQNKDEFALIDKHAAHERLKFDKLKKELVNTSQLLASEFIVELDSTLIEAVALAKDTLLEIGFDMIPLDNYRVQIAAMPSILTGEDLPRLIFELAEKIKNGDSDTSSIFDGILHSIACNSAIKANDNNDIEDLAMLAERVWADKSIRFCPHGRPVIITLKKYELEKMFGRV